MTNFLLLARGESMRSARVVAVSADQVIVDKFFRELAGDGEGPEGQRYLHLMPSGYLEDEEDEG